VSCWTRNDVSPPQRHRDLQPAAIRLAGHLRRLDGDAIENAAASVEPDGSARPLLSPERIARTANHKRARRGRSGAVRPVKWGLTWTTAVKIKNRYGQVSGHFHAQLGTCPASLPSWPCRFDPGHPLHRKTLTSKVFSCAHSRLLLLKRGSRVPSGAVRTTRPRRNQPGRLARQHGRGQPAAAVGSAWLARHVRRRQPSVTSWPRFRLTRKGSSITHAQCASCRFVVAGRS